MPFGNKDENAKCIVFKYGGTPPKEGKEEALRQLLKANIYRNNLIELTRKFKNKYDDLFNEYGPYNELNEQIEELKEAVDKDTKSLKAWRQAEGHRKQHPEFSKRLKENRPKLKDLRSQLREIKNRIKKDPSFKSKKEKLQKEEKADKKRIYNQAGACDPQAEDWKQYGVYWGTRLLVAEAVNLSKKSKGVPKFKKFRGEGSLMVQCQNGRSTEDIFEPGGDVWIYPKPPETAWDESLPRGQRKRLQRTTLHMRVAGGGRTGMEAVILKFPIVLHRPMPENKNIKRVTVTRRLYGNHEKWHTCFYIDMRKGTRLHNDIANNGVCGVDLGFRAMVDKNGSYLRVACCEGSDGERVELKLDQKYLEYIKKAQDLQSIRDKYFNMAIEKLHAFRDQAPDWWKEATKYIKQWKGKNKLVRLFREWSENRWPGDAEAYAVIEKWKEREFHLHPWQRNNERKTRERRLHLYRNFAAELRKKYAVIGIEDVDWRQWSRLPNPEEEKEVCKKFRVQKRDASVGLLSSILQSCGAKVIKVDPSYTTKNCNNCGFTNDFDAEKNLKWTCDSCGVTWDQDFNAARNIKELASAVVV